MKGREGKVRGKGKEEREEKDIVEIKGSKSE